MSPAKHANARWHDESTILNGNGESRISIKAIEASMCSPLCDFVFTAESRNMKNTTYSFRESQKRKL